jgi:hypothetical protein
MNDFEQLYAWAERAVEQEVLGIDPSLVPGWQSVSPTNMGLGADDWLLASKRMVRAFNSLAAGVSNISISEPVRLSYLKRDLIDFVGLIADAAEQVA